MEIGVLEVMLCLQDELNEVPADQKAYRVLHFLVQAKLAELANGTHEPKKYTRTALLLHIEGEQKAKSLAPSRWLTADMLDNFLTGRSTALHARLRRAGLEHTPVIRANEGKGGKGNEREFWLDVAPLPDLTEPTDQGQSWEGIEYVRTPPGEVKSSLVLRQIFHDGELKNRSWRGYLLLASMVCGLLSLALWSLAGMFTASALDQALTLRQLGSVALLLVVTWLVWENVFAPWWRLVDDRVIKAPSVLLSTMEDSAELEMHRDNEGYKWTRFVRFSGDCPICSGRVLLMPGKPDQTLPLVGRCVESPHAHVYSFDRVRLSGVFIGPAPFER